jgi:glycosyltransferase involved in cell wall biosynthesis
MNRFRAARRSDLSVQSVSSIQVPRRLAASAWGGTETTVVQTSRALEEAGHPTQIFTSRALAECGAETFEDVDVKRFSYFYPFFGLSPEEEAELDRKGGNLVSLPLLRALLREPGVDLLHAHTGKRLGGIVRTAARLRRIPYVVTLHGNVFDVPDDERADLLSPIKGKFEWGRALGALLGARRVLTDADAVICVGREEYEAARAAMPSQRVELINNGVDFRRFRSGNGAEFRGRLGLPDSAWVILCVSRIDPQKNQLSLIESLPRVIESVPDAHLVLVGPVTRPGYLDSVHRRVADLGLGDRVHIVEGLRPDDPGLADAFHGADVFCLPSVHEPFGIVLLEAWAAGLPVVASRVGGIAGFVQEDDDALLVDACDIAGRAHAIISLLRNPDLAGRLGAAGRRRARDEFDWSVIAGRVSELYRDVVAGRS